MLIKPLARILMVLASVLSPLSLALAAPPDGGVLITRTSNQNWQVRLIAGSEARDFSGVFESTAKINAVTGVMLEAADSVSLTTTKSLAVTMQSWPNGVDGVNFSTYASAELCLRDTGSTNLEYYLGDTLATAVKVSAPVSLLGTDACGSVPPPPPPPSGRKYNPGHYVALMRGQSGESVMAGSVKPGVTGLMKRYTWRSLEPTQGNYQLGPIQSDLDWAAANGMRLVVMIEDKTFVLERPTPAYLDAFTPRNRAGGYTVVRWSPTVVTRMKALVDAIGARFDNHAALEGIALQETALGFEDSVLNANGYTPEKYRDAYIDILTSASNSLPTSRVFWFMNFFPRNQAYIGSIAEAVASKGVVMGGPDVMPDDEALQSRTYPFYSQFKDRMPLFGQVEPICYAHLHESGSYSTKYWTMNELFTYARDDMHVNYMFWVRLPTAAPADSYDWNDALPVIKNNPTFSP